MSNGTLEPETLIPDLLRVAPQTRPVLDRYGLRGCGGELGPMETLAFFAGAHDVPLLRLLGAAGKKLAEEDDGGLNARITFRAEQAGTYRIHATTFDAGAFTLTIREMANPPKDKSN